MKTSRQFDDVATGFCFFGFDIFMYVHSLGTWSLMFTQLSAGQSAFLSVCRGMLSVDNWGDVSSDLCCMIQRRFLSALVVPNSSLAGTWNLKLSSSQLPPLHNKWRYLIMTYMHDLAQVAPSHGRNVVAHSLQVFCLIAVGHRRLLVSACLQMHQATNVLLYHCTHVIIRHVSRGLRLNRQVYAQTDHVCRIKIYYMGACMFQTTKLCNRLNEIPSAPDSPTVWTTCGTRN